MDLGNAQRIVIAGGPRTGKTTLANRLGDELGIAVRHTDDLIGSRDWSEASAEVANWFDEPGSWIVEGVATPRAIRKALAKSNTLPFDAVVWCSQALGAQTTGQQTMAKGCLTVWREILPALQRCGVRICERT